LGSLTAHAEFPTRPGFSPDRVTAECREMPVRFGDSARAGQHQASIISSGNDFGSRTRVEILDLQSGEVVATLVQTPSQDAGLTSFASAPSMRPGFAQTFTLQDNVAVWSRYRDFGPATESQFICQSK
jgi:hypothetical protein